MGIAQRLTSRLCLPVSHRLTNVPAALLGGAAGSNWILSTGSWNDSGLWDDTQNWMDI